MTKVKRLAIITLLAVAFWWLVHTILVFYGYTMQWGKLEVGTNILISQLVFFIIKNIPTVVAVIIGRKYWN